MILVPTTLGREAIFIMIKMNRKYIDKTFDECFQDFLLEHCTLNLIRMSCPFSMKKEVLR
ncbi:hypothetical protein [Clostridium sp.]|uniref:hypothetical protein n=1 Tax=Clostridium sp. TaxID=1506 RepID=UPI00260DB00A|nr:hypothetical protein [Clostridium sp.]